VPPFDRRQVQISGDARREHATANGRPQYYDARANTIYTTPPGIELPRPGREGEDRLLDNLRSFLASGDAREDSRVTVDGRDAIRIVFFRAWARTLGSTELGPFSRRAR
jgi:hypothetical protein